MTEAKGWIRPAEIWRPIEDGRSRYGRFVPRPENTHAELTRPGLGTWQQSMDGRVRDQGLNVPVSCIRKATVRVNNTTSLMTLRGARPATARQAKVPVVTSGTMHLEYLPSYLSNCTIFQWASGLAGDVRKATGQLGFRMGSPRLASLRTMWRRLELQKQGE